MLTVLPWSDEIKKIKKKSFKQKLVGGTKVGSYSCANFFIISFKQTFQIILILQLKSPRIFHTSFIKFLLHFNFMIACTTNCVIYLEPWERNNKIKLTTREKLNCKPKTMFNSAPLNQETAYVFCATANDSPPMLKNF